MTTPEVDTYFADEPEIPDSTETTVAQPLVENELIEEPRPLTWRDKALLFTAVTAGFIAVTVALTKDMDRMDGPDRARAIAARKAADEALKKKEEDKKKLKKLLKEAHDAEVTAEATRLRVAAHERDMQSKAAFLAIRIHGRGQSSSELGPGSKDYDNSW